MRAKLLERPSLSVYLDGAKVKHAIEADTVEGWVRHYVVDAKGLMVRGKDTGCAVETVSHGSVEFRDRSGNTVTE